jgi:regulator of protease activity HflC (stomatin/prohibitin superfamily)
MMPLDITVAYRLVASDAPWLYRNIGPDYVDKVIRPAARTAVREAVAGFTAQESYSTRREPLAQRMHELLTLRLKSLLSQHEDFNDRSAFLVEQVMIRNVQLPPKVKDAIEEKLSAEQQALRMQFVLQKERQEAERKRIEAQGIADFQKIVTQGISEPLLAWKGIEATEQLAHSTNAKIVIIGNPKNGMPLIVPLAER